LRLLVLALLCVVAYAPSLTLPLIEDDFPNLQQAQIYGAPSAVPALAAHTVYRLRATSTWTMYWMWRAFGPRPLPYHALSVALHILDAWLLYAVALAWPRFRAAAFWAAAFFAVAAAHQEAIMWFSAINELWAFFFGALALWCWLEDRPWGIVPFPLALISKESAVVWLPLMFLAAPSRNWRKWAPYAAVAAFVTGSVFFTRDTSFRFGDGSFSWHAPFWITWPRGIARTLWPWGWFALAATWFMGRKLLAAGGIALAWIAIALLPYSFLLYSTEIPSRQAYLAGAGLALLVGVALTLVRDRRLVAAVAGIVLLANVGYLWTKKRDQFVRRAAPTEELIALARSTPRPIWVRCFPRVGWIAEEAVHMSTGRPVTDLVWTEADARARNAVEFCFTSPSSRRQSSSPTP
jgi:hypothetical protein